MSIKLTKKQKLLLDYIDEFIKNTGFSPSYREIATGLGLNSPASVSEHVENLVKLGALKKASGTARSLEVVDFSYPETTELFNRQINLVSHADAEILRQAADILNITIQSPPELNQDL